MTGGFSNNKIMLLTAGLKRAGQEKVVYELALGFQSKGYEIEVASFYGGPYKEALASLNIKVSLLSESDSNTKVSKIQLYKNFKNLVETKSDYNFIFHGIGFEKLWVLHTLIFRKKPFSVFVFHNNYPFINKRNLNFKRLQLKLFLRFIDKVVFIKKSMMIKAVDNCILQANQNIKVIENGIEIPKPIESSIELLNLKSKLGFENEDKILLQVGRFADQKNQIISIKALELLRYKMPNLKLVLLGEGKNMAICKNYVSKAKLNNRVIFKGNVPNVNEYINIAHLFLMPSDFEGHPIALIEAMMLNLKPVVFKAPGIKDFLPVDLDCLDYVVPKTPTRMAEILLSRVFTKSTHSEDNLFMDACEWVRQNYSHDKMVQNYINLLTY